MSGEERFSASGVARSYAWDRLDAKQWLLIYRDSNASRTYALAAILFPTASIVAFILFIDFFKNGPRNRTAFVQKLCKDATELGALAAFPIVCFFIVIFGLARVQNLRLFRIYQNIENPYRFIAIVPRSGVLQRKMQFDRSSAVLIADSDGIESQSLNLWRMFVSGSLLLNERRFVHDDDCFRANNFRSFMLSETDTLPREVALKHRS
ncbi:unnamed protein product [Toxocara canis]|uniref:BPH_2 domain-containing protein n=1 Tax=Toxocara canis TaxID=6265 RepID=A0A183V1E7_TOXCA|nr:unnamed protein product [Toxocara canis]